MEYLRVFIILHKDNNFIELFIYLTLTLHSLALKTELVIYIFNKVHLSQVYALRYFHEYCTHLAEY